MIESLYTNALMNYNQVLLSASGGSILEFNKEFLYRTGIQWLNVVILFVVLIIVLYKPVKRYMRDRTERIQNDVVSAKAELQSALKLKDEYTEKLANIEKEKEEILASARKKAHERADHILEEAHKEVEAIFDNVKVELEITRKNNESELKQQLIELSSLIASRFVEVSIDASTQQKFVDDALEGWEEDLWRD